MGAGVGIAIAAPVGPVSLLCVREAVARGFRAAVALGCGAALADAVAGSGAAFGLHGVAFLWLAWQRWSRHGLALALMLLGMQVWRTARCPARVSIAGTPGFTTALLLTLLNPLNVAAFAALLAGLGLVEMPLRDAVLVAAGIAVGATLWWVALAAVAARLRVGARHLATANRLIAILLVAAAASTAASVTITRPVFGTHEDGAPSPLRPHEAHLPCSESMRARTGLLVVRHRHGAMRRLVRIPLSR